MEIRLSRTPYRNICIFIETGFDVNTPQQGGRSWQGKNDRKKIRQAGIDYFCDKSVDFARNCKSANIT